MDLPVTDYENWSMGIYPKATDIDSTDHSIWILMEQYNGVRFVKYEIYFWVELAQI